jgi:hypothetical protein
VVVVAVEHVPKLLETSHEAKETILRNQKCRDSENGTCLLIDIAISEYRNMITKEAENILKYKYPTTEIQRMWNVKTK